MHPPRQQVNDVFRQLAPVMEEKQRTSLVRSPVATPFFPLGYRCIAGRNMGQAEGPLLRIGTADPEEDSTDDRFTSISRTVHSPGAADSTNARRPVHGGGDRPGVGTSRAARRGTDNAATITAGASATAYRRPGAKDGVMMRQTIALIVDAYRELNYKKLFWITLIISAIVVLSFLGVKIDDDFMTVFGMKVNSDSTRC